MSFLFTYRKNPFLPDVIEIEPSFFDDERGSLWTSFEENLFESELMENFIPFKHDKFSFTKKNVIRGLHGDNKSWKLVSCPYGEVFQVVVDARDRSDTYMKTATTILSGKNKKMLLIPPRFGNGFCAYKDDALYHYKLAYEGSYNDFDSQFTIAWNDSRLNISWPIEKPILSSRDAL